VIALTCDLDILLARKTTTFSTVSLPLRYFAEAGDMRTYSSVLVH